MQNQGCDVWARSKELGDELCHKETYDDAVALCEENGARLCTKAELEDNCAWQTKCFSPDSQAWVSDEVEPIELDRHDPPIQVVCDGRKVGFQIDPAQINVKDWMGYTFTVEMGNIGADSESNILDMNGNPIEQNVK